MRRREREKKKETDPEGSVPSRRPRAYPIVGSQFSFEGRLSSLGTLS